MVLHTNLVWSNLVLNPGSLSGSLALNTMRRFLQLTIENFIRLVVREPDNAIQMTLNKIQCADQEGDRRQIFL